MSFKWWSFAVVVCSSFIFLVLTGSFSSGGERDRVDAMETEKKQAGLPQKITTAPISKQFYFAGERIPTENFDVRERLDKELTVNSYYHSSTLLLLKRKKRYFKIIEPILREEGVPDDFKYLAVAESALTNATSPAGAKGVWQFMRSTGRAYGLEVNGSIDERFHLEKSTRAACQLLKDYKERFGTWALAGMAYNGGETRIARNLKQQRAEHFYELNLNAETMRYLFRILALKDILEHPDRYGYYLEKEEIYPDLPQHKTITVDTTIADLGAFCESFGISYRQLKIYNPWLLQSHLPNRSRRTYELKIPFDS